MSLHSINSFLLKGFLHRFFINFVSRFGEQNGVMLLMYLCVLPRLFISRFTIHMNLFHIHEIGMNLFIYGFIYLI